MMNPTMFSIDKIRNQILDSIVFQKPSVVVTIDKKPTKDFESIFDIDEHNRFNYFFKFHKEFLDGRAYEKPFIKELDELGYYEIDKNNYKTDELVEIILGFLDRYPDDLYNREYNIGRKTELIHEICLDLIYNLRIDEALYLTDQIFFPEFLWLEHFYGMFDSLIIQSIQLRNYALDKQIDKIINKMVKLCDDNIVNHYRLEATELKASYALIVLHIFISFECKNEDVNKRTLNINAEIDDFIKTYINCGREINIVIYSPFEKAIGVFNTLMDLNFKENAIYILDKLSTNDSYKFEIDYFTLLQKYLELRENNNGNFSSISNSYYATQRGWKNKLFCLINETLDLPEDEWSELDSNSPILKKNESLINLFELLIYSINKSDSLNLSSEALKIYKDVLRISTNLSNIDILTKINKYNSKIFADISLIKAEIILLDEESSERRKINFLENSLIFASNITSDKYECNCGKYKTIRYKGIVCEICKVECRKDGAKLITYEYLMDILKLSKGDLLTSNIINRFVNNASTNIDSSELYFLFLEYFLSKSYSINDYFNSNIILNSSCETVFEYINNDKYINKYKDTQPKLINLYLNLIEKYIINNNHFDLQLILPDFNLLINSIDSDIKKSNVYYRVSKIYIDNNLLEDSIEFLNKINHDSYAISVFLIDKLGLNFCLRYINKSKLNKEDFSRAICDFLSKNKSDKIIEYIYLCQFYSLPICNFHFLEYKTKILGNIKIENNKIKLIEKVIQISYE